MSTSQTDSQIIIKRITTESTAEMAATIVNAYNHLVTGIGPDVFMYNPSYVAMIDNKIAGVISIKRTSWYQCEFSYLSVLEAYRKHGVGRALLQHAASKTSARIAQCTIRRDNINSIRLIQQQGFEATVEFINHGNMVIVFNKVLANIDKDIHECDN
jgi:GNAT superfamily N-acetyltransferase